MSSVRASIRNGLLASRLGQWLLIARHPTYLDQFARVSKAVALYKQAPDQQRLRFRLHRCIHRVEKSMAMPARRAGGGADAMRELAVLLQRWRAVASVTHPTYLWGIDVGAEYFRLLDSDVSASNRGEGELAALRGDLGSRWSGIEVRPTAERVTTPLNVQPPVSQEDRQAFERVLRGRKSVRRWQDEPVPRAVIEQAMEHALLAPSACNRQPIGAVVLEERDKIRMAAALLTGGGGFAESAPVLLALTSDFSAYGGHEQRNLAYIDGGLSAMAFLLSLSAQGYGCVSLNWSVEVARDQRARELLGIRETQIILFWVAVGKAHPQALIPASTRRPIGESLVWSEAVPV